MDRRLLHAEHLLDLRRPAEAERALRAYLAEHASDADALGMLAFALLQQGQHDAARHFAEQAIGQAPDQAVGHLMLGQVQLAMRQLAAAEETARRVIALEPLRAVGQALLATVLVHRKRWREALAAADAGLAVEPDDERCTALRARALNGLGRHAEAEAAAADQLRRSPDDAWAHLSRGVTALHAGQIRSAREHFRTALRLDPTLEPARDGLREALRAGHWFYRPVLSYFLWLERLSGRRQIAVVLGGYVLYRVAAGFTSGGSVAAWAATALVVLYIGFALLTFLGRPVANAVLCLSSDGRRALDRSERIEAAALGTALLGAAALAGRAALVGGAAAVHFLDAIVLLLCCIVAAQAGAVGGGYAGRWLYRATAVYAVAGLLLVWHAHDLFADTTRIDAARAELRALGVQFEEAGVEDFGALLQRLQGLDEAAVGAALEQELGDATPTEQQRVAELVRELTSWARQSDVQSMVARQQELDAQRDRFATFMLIYAVAAFWGAQLLAAALVSRAPQRGR